MLLGMPTKQTWPGHTPSITMLRYALRRAPPLLLPDNFHARPPSKTQLWHSPDTLAETTRGKGRGGNDALPRGFARATALRKRPPAPSLLHSNMSQSQGHAHRLCLKLCLKKEAHQGSAERGCRLCFRRPSPGQRRGHVKGLWPRATLTAWRKSDSCSIPTASMPMHAEITCFATASPSAVRSEH